MVLESAVVGFVRVQLKFSGQKLVESVVRDPV